MDSSIFLARLLGPVMLALGAYVVIHPERVRRAGREILASDALLLIAGVIALPAGLAIVLTHNLWVADWRGLITLMGWIMVLAGLARILLPGTMQRLGEAMLARVAAIALPGVLMAAIGAYLSYRGFAG